MRARFPAAGETDSDSSSAQHAQINFMDEEDRMDVTWESSDDEEGVQRSCHRQRKKT